MAKNRAEEPANFLMAMAPAPYFFSKRLRFLIFSQAPGFFFFERLRLQGAKNMRLRLSTIG